MPYLSKEEEEKYNRDLTNQKFGKITVLYNTGKKSKNHYIIWHCQCDCGKELDIKSTRLINNLITSCGCNKTIYLSKGEEKIGNLLDKNNISFKKEKTFDNCKFPDTNYLAKFDFYVNDEYIIEFDGKQHFSYTKSKHTWNNEENFLKTQEHDNFKNQWCKEHNIPIIRIPYTHLKDLCIEDLILTTSSFLV